MNGKWIRKALIILTAEKVIQHSFVTIALLRDIGDIRSGLAIDYRILMVSGFLVGILFAVSLWGMLKNREWAVRLITGLALFDLIGEFIAQGTLMIICTVSFVVALVLLILSIRYSRQSVL